MVVECSNQSFNPQYVAHQETEGSSSDKEKKRSGSEIIKPRLSGQHKETQKETETRVSGTQETKKDLTFVTISILEKQEKEGGNYKC